MDLTHAEVAKEIVENPEQYGAFSEEYGGADKLYAKLRSAAPSEIETFDDYLEFFDLFLERGPTQVVTSDLEETLARALKNMVLRDSQAGRAYPVHTLSKISERLDRYRSLSREVSLPTEQEVVETIVEHVYDDENHNRYSYEIFSSLLTETDVASSDAVEFVARARLIAGIEQNKSTGTELQRQAERYFESISDPLPADDRDVDELFEEISSRPVDDKELPRLYSTAAYRSRQLEDLYEFLYLEARDVIERYRHHYRQQPSRAELLVAKRQLELLSTRMIDEWGADDQAYVKSYTEVARAISAAGGRWVSDQDRQRWPEPDFQTATEAYAAAATSIRGINDQRYIKYVSKSIRHAGHAAPDWHSRKELHDYANVMILDLKQRSEFDDDVDPVIDSTIAYHNHQKAVAQAHLNFNRGKLRDALTAISDAEEYRKEIPQDNSSHTELELLSQLVSARLTEQDGKLDQAETQYSLIEIRDHRVKTRLDLLEIKRALKAKNETTAVTKAQDSFGEGTLITAAVTAAAGLDITTTTISDETPLPIPAANNEPASVLPVLLNLYSNAPSLRDSLQPLLKQAIIEL